jgi:hypothetical protein
MVGYPPLYPLTLALPRAFGVSGSDSARLVNAIALAALVVLIGVALWWLLRPPLIVLVVLEVLVICGPSVGSVQGALNPLGLAGFALSEALFLPICLGTLLAGALASKSAAPKAVVIAGGLAALATFARYVGVSSGIGAGAAVLLCGSWSLRRRLKRAVPIALAGPALLIGWNLLTAISAGGGAAKTLAWHPGSPHIHLAVTVMSAWFQLPHGWPSALRAAVIVVLVLVTPMMVLLRPVRRLLYPTDPSGIGATVMVALGAFSLSYLLALGVTEVLLDASTQPNQRLLAPVQLASYLLLAAVVTLAAQHLAPATDVGRCLACATVVVAALVCAYGPLTRLDVSASAFKRGVRAEHAEAAHDPLRAVPRGTVVFTDDPSGLWLYADLDSYRLPTLVAETTGRRNPSFSAEVRQVELIVEQRGGLIVVAPVRSAEYTDGTALGPIGRCTAGQVVLGVPGTPAALVASRVCPL